MHRTYTTLVLTILPCNWASQFPFIINFLCLIIIRVIYVMSVIEYPNYLVPRCHLTICIINFVTESLNLIVMFSGSQNVLYCPSGRALLRSPGRGIERKRDRQGVKGNIWSYKAVMRLWSQGGCHSIMFENYWSSSLLLLLLMLSIPNGRSNMPGKYCWATGEICQMLQDSTLPVFSRG